MSNYQHQSFEAHQPPKNQPEADMQEVARSRRDSVFVAKRLLENTAQQTGALQLEQANNVVSMEQYRQAQVPPQETPQSKQPEAVVNLDDFRQRVNDSYDNPQSIHATEPVKLVPPSPQPIQNPTEATAAREQLAQFYVETPAEIDYEAADEQFSDDEPTEELAA